MKRTPVPTRASARWYALPLFLAILALPSCADATLAATNPDLMTTVEPVMLGASVLKHLDQMELRPGDRIPASVQAGGLDSIPFAAISIRDSAVLALDQTATLFARAPGITWLVWPGNDGPDSSRITVSEPSGAQTDDYVQPVGPQKFVDVRMPASRTRVAPGRVWRVAQGQDLQAVLNAAVPGDQVVLAQGATFTGNYVLPAKTGSSADWIIVRAETLPSAAGTRTSPQLAEGSARIVTPDQDPAIFAAPGARRWRLIGFTVEHKQDAIYNYGIVVLGRGDEKTLALQPSEIILDRMYVHGSTAQGTSRCVAFNGRSLAVIDSWLSECHAKGNDAQGIAGWSGAGPFLIENNRIEGSGQAVMFGGADPQIANVSPSDITIRRNYFYKPLDWMNGKWTVKATFELKHARRVLFEGNVLENHWADAQTGFAILFQAVSQEGVAPWSTVLDVLVQNNIIRNSASGINLLARFSAVVATPTSRISFQNNLFINVGIDPGSRARGRLVQLLGELIDVSLVRNTFVLGGSATYAVVLDGAPGVRTRILGNVFPETEYGIFGSGLGTGINALNTFAPGGHVTSNALPGQIERFYPEGNFFPANVAASVDGSRTDLVCEQSQRWMTAMSIPAGVGVDCESLLRAVRTTISAVP